MLQQSDVTAVSSETQLSPRQEAMVRDQSEIERRASGDRRQKPTSFWDAFRLAGRRTRCRRTREHRRPYFVDRFSPAMLLLVLLLTLFTISDGILTVYLIGAGVCEEANPLMDYLLGHGLVLFFLGKYSLSVGGLPVLLIFKNWYLFGTRFRVGDVLVVLAVLYSALLIYELYIIRMSIRTLLF
jgi:hypothetical protein